MTVIENVGNITRSGIDVEENRSKAMELSRPNKWLFD